MSSRSDCPQKEPVYRRAEMILQSLALTGEQLTKKNRGNHLTRLLLEIFRPFPNLQSLCFKARLTAKPSNSGIVGSLMGSSTVFYFTVRPNSLQNPQLFINAFFCSCFVI